mgnify:FL=1
MEEGGLSTQRMHACEEVYRHVADVSMLTHGLRFCVCVCVCLGGGGPIVGMLLCLLTLRWWGGVPLVFCSLFPERRCRWCICVANNGTALLSQAVGHICMCSPRVLPVIPDLLLLTKQQTCPPFAPVTMLPVTHHPSPNTGAPYNTNLRQHSTFPAPAAQFLTIRS